MAAFRDIGDMARVKSLTLDRVAPSIVYGKPSDKPHMLGSPLFGVECVDLAKHGDFSPMIAQGTSNDPGQLPIPGIVNGVLKCSGALDNQEADCPPSRTAALARRTADDLVGSKSASWNLHPNGPAPVPLADYHIDSNIFSLDVPPCIPPLPAFVLAEIGNNEETGPIGSRGHATGTCKPCAHFWKPAGCNKGDDCERCHLCDEKAFKKYREGSRKHGRGLERVRNRQDLSRMQAKTSKIIA